MNTNVLEIHNLEGLRVCTYPVCICIYIYIFTHVIHLYVTKFLMGRIPGGGSGPRFGTLVFSFFLLSVHFFGVSGHRNRFHVH